MPKTNFQRVVFTMIMVFCMVYSMTVYTLSLQTGGLNYSVLALAIKEMWVEYIVVFILIFFFITKTSVRAAHRLIDKKKDSPILMTVAIQSVTVMLIVPMITLFATFFHQGFTGSWLIQWISTAAVCFPAAYFLQIFLIGPFVRHLFRFLFRKQLA
ncbi:MAG: DUF2798 domain-containing protein [Lachnospiraceae bacterium]|jgi:hypothetical protein